MNSGNECSCCSKRYNYSNLLDCIDCKKQICQDCYFYNVNRGWGDLYQFRCAACFFVLCKTEAEKKECCGKYWHDAELADFKALGSYEFVAEAVSYYEALKFAENFDTSKLE